MEQMASYTLYPAKLDSIVVAVVFLCIEHLEVSTYTDVLEKEEVSNSFIHLQLFSENHKGATLTG